MNRVYILLFPFISTLTSLYFLLLFACRPPESENNQKTLPFLQILLSWSFSSTSTSFKLPDLHSSCKKVERSGIHNNLPFEIRPLFNDLLKRSNRKLLFSPTFPTMAPSHRRGPWVPEEDQTLLQLVHTQGPNNWVRISQQMHFRSPKQCRERFHQNLKPTLNHEPISADEGLMIERMVNEMGKRWAEIARRLGNRSDNAVKNWWNGSMNRKRRGLVIETRSGHSSRSFNGRVEPPYPRASLASPHRRSFYQRDLPPSWGFSDSHMERPLHASQFPHHVETSSGSMMTEERRPSNHMDYDFDQSRHLPASNVSRQLSPIYTMSSRQVEAPLTSPAFSEISNAASINPPSMVSDHNSVSSISPRTVPSPQLPSIPAELRNGQADLRRGSAPNIHIHNPSSFANDESYYSASNCAGGGKNMETLSHVAAMERWAADLRPSTSSAQYQQHPSTFPHTRVEDISLNGHRDNRMGLNSLLN